MKTCIIVSALAAVLSSSGAWAWDQDPFAMYFQRSDTITLGAGNANGIGIFWDMAGDDTYRTQEGTTMGGANYDATGLRGSMLCLGIFLDTGGGKDTYPSNVGYTGNNKLWRQPARPGVPEKAPARGVGLDE